MIDGVATIPRRQSLRLGGYDYTQPGAYFVTVCTKDRLPLFGEVTEGRMRLNAFGDIVRGCWEDLPRHYAHVALDAFVVMPNHVHGVIVITRIWMNAHRVVGAGLKPAPTMRHGLSEIVRAFKTFSARRVNVLRGTPAQSVWQRNYYEHVIRHENEWGRIRQYIVENPMQWALDRENPAAHVAPCVHVGAGFKPAPTNALFDDGDGVRP